VLEQLPCGAHVVIMTHASEDYALCDAALRLSQPRGRAGDRSAAQVDALLRPAGDAGTRPGAIGRINLPIGKPGIPGKDRA